jgi:hypothetical protein
MRARFVLEYRQTLMLGLAYIDVRSRAPIHEFIYDFPDHLRLMIGFVKTFDILQQIPKYSLMYTVLVELSFCRGSISKSKLILMMRFPEWCDFIIFLFSSTGLEEREYEYECGIPNRLIAPEAVIRQAKALEISIKIAMHNKTRGLVVAEPFWLYRRRRPIIRCKHSDRSRLKS